MYLAHQAQLAASGVIISMDPGVALTVLDQALNLQVTYGAVMLSFLGSSQWSVKYVMHLNEAFHRCSTLGHGNSRLWWS